MNKLILVFVCQLIHFFQDIFCSNYSVYISTFFTLPNLIGLQKEDTQEKEDNSITVKREINSHTCLDIR